MYCKFGEPSYGYAVEHNIKWGDYIYFSVGSVPLGSVDPGTNKLSNRCLILLFQQIFLYLEDEMVRKNCIRFLTRTILTDMLCLS